MFGVLSGLGFEFGKICLTWKVRDTYLVPEH